MPSTYNTARTVLRGINDQSTVAQETPREEFPTHLPHCMIYASRGKTEIGIYNKVAAEKIYGSSTFDIRGPYFNHQTLLVNGFFGEANVVALQRVIPKDALPPAGFVLWADVLETDIVQYERDVNTGKFLLDVGGNKTPVTPASTFPGVSIKFSTSPLHRVNADGDIITQSMIDDFEGGDTSVDIVAVDNVYGEVPSMLGTRTDGTNVSVMYKVGEFGLDEIGEFGKRAGLKLYPVTSNSTSPVGEDYIQELGAFLFRMQVVFSETDNATPAVKETVFGGQYTQFSFKEGTIDPFIDADISASQTLIDYYDRARFTGNSVEETPLFNNINIFYENIEAICDLIGSKEAASNPDFDFVAGTDTYKINFMTGVNYSNVPYITFELVGPSGGGINLSPINTMMAVGGSDGTMTDDLFDDLVADQCVNFGSLENKVLDMARFPMSAIYDTGFSMDTKEAMARIPALRKDYIAGFTPWVHGLPIMSESDHMNACIAISNMIRVYAESDYYATPATRYFIVGQQGKLVGHPYRGVVPGIYNFLMKIAAYMGASNRRWKSEVAPDEGSGKDIKGMSNVNLVSLTDDVRDQYTALGVIMAIYKNRETLFIPSQTSAYKKGGSVLNSILTVYALADVQKICYLVWTDLCGNTKLTDDEYVEETRNRIMEEINSRNFYDNRFIVSVTPRYTAEDKRNGKSITVDVNMAANKGKDVFTFTVNATDQSATV